MRLKIPYGYRIVNGKAEPDPVDAAKLMRLFELVVEGEKVATAARIAGIDRTSTCCRDLLGYRLYLGTDYYPQLIPEELWQTVSKEISLRAAPFAGRTGKMVTEPNPIQTKFVMERVAVRCDDPAEYAAMLYEKIRPRKKVSKAPENASGVF